MSRANAQVIIPAWEEMFSVLPWNAHQIFEPTALPQLTDPDTRDGVAPEDTPVKDRFRPEYQARGIRAGAWMFNPTLTTGALYDSNVFSSPSNREGDIAERLGASLSASSLWGRHGISMGLSTGSLFYQSHPDLNQTNAAFGASGHLDIDHSTQLLGTFNAASLHEQVGSLNSPLGAVKPTPYSSISGDLALRKEFGRVTTAVGVAVNSYNFGSTLAQNGSIISQDALDGQIYIAHGRVDYAFSEKLAAFTAVEGNWRDLRGTPDQSLESNGYRVLSGFDLEFTHLIKGEIAAGYERQHFFSSSIGNVEGPAYRAMLTWSPSRQVDVHFNAEQIVTESWDLGSSGIRADAVQAGFDYEFRPNVVLLTAATYEKDHFQGQPREDNVYAVDARVKYALNNLMSISLGYRYTLRDSNVPAASFDKHQVGVNASAHF
jgi:hypothetical protein